MAYEVQRAALIQYVVDALRPRGPLRAQSKSAPFGSPYGMDYMDLVDNHGVTRAEVKSLKDKMRSVYPALKQFVKDHPCTVIVTAQQSRHAPRR